MEYIVKFAVSTINEEREFEFTSSSNWKTMSRRDQMLARVFEGTARQSVANYTCCQIAHKRRVRFR